MFDIASIQVLKGPQGTLFGRSSVGGAVLVETRRPESEFGGYVSAAVEDPSGYTIDGAVNIPLGEDVGLRLAGIRQYVRGYTKVLNGNYHLDDKDRYALRGTLEFKRGIFENTLIGDYFHNNSNGAAFFAKAYNPT